MNICSIKGCFAKPVARGYCRKHYTRFYNYGSPHFVKRIYIRGVSPYERIMSKIVKDKKTGCWNFIGKLNDSGYGKITIFKDNKRILIHRFMYEHYNGKIPKGLCVCHSCDNPRCCNPEHLWLGTRADNVKDMYGKGRCACGEDSGNSKLTVKSVNIIRKMYAEYKNGRGNHTQTSLAKKFGVSQNTIHKIINNITWVCKVGSGLVNPQVTAICIDKQMDRLRAIS